MALITFSSKASADITMFADVATALLKHMGQSGVVPGAIVAADVPAALDRLRAAVAEKGAEPSGPASADRGREGEERLPVTLRQRAFPLVTLLEHAAKAKADVMWETARNPLR